MAKNTYLIEQAKMLKRYENKLKHDIEELYSAVCIVLKRNGNSDDDVASFIGQVQDLWYEVANNPDVNMCDLCVEETGFDIREKCDE